MSTPNTKWNNVILKNQNDEGVLIVNNLVLQNELGEDILFHNGIFEEQETKWNNIF